MGGKYRFSGLTVAEIEQISIDCGLTEREEQVLLMRSRTDRVWETADRLGWSDRTIKRDCQSIARKMARSSHRIRHNDAQQKIANY